MMQKYILLPPAKVDKPEPVLLTASEFLSGDYRDKLSGVVGLDFEANTYDYAAKDFYVRTIGLANDNIAVSIDLKDIHFGEAKQLYAWLKDVPYVAHNLAMEAGCMEHLCGRVGKPVCDTFVVFADLASEERTSHSLAAGMEELLGQEKEGDLVKEHMKANKWTWADVKEFDFALLGRYNAIDAWGCWGLYKYFQKVVGSYKDSWGAHYWQYHQEDCLNEVLLQVEARLSGITVNRDALMQVWEQTTLDKAKAMEEFVGHPEVAAHIQEYQAAAIQAVADSEPPEFTKAGKRTARHIKWEERLKVAREEFHFNTNSTTQLRWLFFDKMGLEPVELTEKGEPSTSAACLSKMGEAAGRLLDYRSLTTKLKFLEQVRAGMGEDSIIRPQVRPFATLSTRCGGGKLE